MSLPRKIGRIAAIPIMLILTSADTHRVCSGEQSPKDNGAVESRGSDWSLQVNPTGKLEFACKGVPVLSNDTVFWGRDFAWAGATMKFEPSGQGQYRMTGDVVALGLKMAGTAHWPATNVFQMDLLLRAEQAKKDIIGGGWQWNFKLKSPVLEGRASAPELLPDRPRLDVERGPGQSITLRFEEQAVGGLLRAREQEHDPDVRRRQDHRARHATVPGDPRAPRRRPAAGLPKRSVIRPQPPASGSPAPWHRTPRPWTSAS